MDDPYDQPPAKKFFERLLEVVGSILAIIFGLFILAIIVGLCYKAFIWVWG